MHHKFYLGNAIDCLKQIESETVQCVITSPPYFGLRDYGLPSTEWPEIIYSPMAGIPSITVPPMICCHGLEPDPLSFIAHEVYIFREIRRILRHDGTIWVNFGDSYCANGKGGRAEFDPNLEGVKSKQIPRGSGRWGGGNNEVLELKPKDLMGIPWRVAFALQAEGWYLRSDIIWSKTNPMPSSTKDRPTLSHEYVFLLAKKAHYYYDNEAIKEEAAYPEGPHSPDKIKSPYGQGFTRKNSAYSFARTVKESHTAGPSNHRPDREDKEYCGKRNKRTVWEISTEPCPEAHFATFPTKLVEPCILAGTSPKACPKCRAPWKRVLEPSEEYAKFLGKSYHDHSNDIYQGLSQKKVFPRTFADYNTVDWKPTCKCEGNDGSGKCIVLDPFGGSGTTALVSQYLGRDSIYIDLNPDYLDIALKRNDFNGLLHVDTWEIINLLEKSEAIS